MTVDLTFQPLAPRLWSLLSPPEGTFIRYFAKKEGLTTGGVIRDSEHLHFLMALFREKGWDAYIQPNPTRDQLKKRVNAKDVSHYRWFTMDIDPISSTIDPNAFEINVPKPLMNLQNSALYVNTGRGIQVWWRAVEIEIHGNAESLRYANACMLKETYLSNKHWKVDFLPDLPRLVRMPGTINSKTGRIASIARWPAYASELLDPFNAMEWAGDPPPPPEIPILQKAMWQHALPHLSLLAKTFIMEGVDSKNPENAGRHHAAVAAARSLRDAQIPYDGALVAVLRGAQRCRPALDSDTSFTTYEVMRIVASAYGVGG